MSGTIGQSPIVTLRVLPEVLARTKERIASTRDRRLALGDTIPIPPITQRNSEPSPLERPKFNRVSCRNRITTVR